MFDEGVAECWLLFRPAVGICADVDVELCEDAAATAAAAAAAAATAALDLAGRFAEDEA